ncbi:PREDICTED: uncharacterized protein LOC104806458 [Tarenaya hassleriana]|uniref:uncharacterized protein LOC104806458 n=1 Tax=Tarenaya hassleriana TaxID=28532 RepID=UPI00053C6E45|nr:PREDICTED: uncharacterized protein LOC104806458 [Tarenaya hassleriana]
MKGRSYWFPTTEPHEDWVDGSWTVDCVCGVNFDDGEEMVNCDECGVWVHTRCSQYVKGDELFTCDKCKSKNNVNDSEETEVAQLLVELPTKTLRMEKSYGRSGPLRHPFRLWTEIPMEERVHVQGIPGGDPALFEGLSSVFSRELWKCTGYVPKKFNFKYREFPCWDKEEKDEAQNACENGPQAENGAGVLFSMSTENVVDTPASALVCMRSLGDKETDSLKLGVKDTKRLESEVVDTIHSQNAMKKDKSLLRPLLMNKQRKEMLEASKDRMKKKVKHTDKEEDEKKCFVRKTAFRRTIDSKPSESRKDRDPEGFSSDVGSIKSEKSKENVPEDANDRDLASGGDKTSNTAIAVECSRDLQLSNVHAHGAGKQDERVAHHVRIVLKTSAISDPSSLEEKSVVYNQAKEERQSTIVDTSEDNAEGSPGSSAKPSVSCTVGTSPEVDGKKLNDVCGSNSCGKNSLQKEMDDANAGGAVGQQALDRVDSEGAETSTYQISGASEFNKMKLSSTFTDKHNMQSLDRASERVINSKADKADELSSHPAWVKREVVCTEGSMIAQKDTLESKPESRLLQERPESCRPVSSTISGYSQPKVVVCIGKSSSSAAMEKSSGHTASENFSPGSKQQPRDGHTKGERDRASIDVVRDRDRDDSSGKALKEHPKYSTSSKLVQQGRVSHSSVSKRNAPDSMAASSSSKASSAQTNCSVEAAGSLLNQHSSQLQNKQLFSGIPQKGDKPGQPISQSSSKKPAQSTHSMAPNSSALLSDEELALLLHQELNSSPRVPRVPRMRQPGSLPQLASSAATSLLMKRTSSSGSKDHGSFSRRKNKDISKDGFRTSRDVDKVMKSTRLCYSPDRKAQDSGSRGSAYTKGEKNETPKTPYFSRKVFLPLSSTTSTSSGQCSSSELNEHSVPSPHSSPRTTSDGGPMHQTLPSLINEIMSKGERMTYEELCNAVLPHWPHLRKHNGERYAYSSHSQAVLDCLRNRHEWARLVDRGPKTNSSRRKRKPDSEESDENITSKGQETVEGGEGKQLCNSQGEGFPKGKRKARKRRRLALQGKGIRELRKKKDEEMSEEEEETEASEDAFSDSSEESIFSEEEDMEPGGNTTAGREVSSSSEDTETTS